MLLLHGYKNGMLTSHNTCFYNNEIPSVTKLAFNRIWRESYKIIANKDDACDLSSNEYNIYST